MALQIEERLRKEQEIERNYAFFLENEASLKEKHGGKYALIRQCEFVGFFDTARDASITGQKLFEDGMFSIQQVAARPVDLGFFSHAVSMGDLRE